MQIDHLKRREFICLVAQRLVGRARRAPQQSERMRRVAILMDRGKDDAEGLARVGTFKEAMEQLGWSEGRNMEINIRWGEDEIDLERKYAAELLALRPDIILASGYRPA